ncbi:hypothetical protein KHA80_10550 [Anaerobacillus sp. HL2]|nr:hypothetical protein KHA80_10550 [Anaerobacillus sp. HL2]
MKESVFQLSEDLKESYDYLLIVVNASVEMDFQVK